MSLGLNKLMEQEVILIIVFSNEYLRGCEFLEEIYVTVKSRI